MQKNVKFFKLGLYFDVFYYIICLIKNAVGFRRIKCTSTML